MARTTNRPHGLTQGNSRKESCSLGLKESGQDRLDSSTVLSKDVRHLLGTAAPGGSEPVGNTVMADFPGTHTLLSSSGTTTAAHPWLSVSHGLPEFGQQCPESEGGRKDKSQLCATLPPRLLVAPSLSSSCANHPHQDHSNTTLRPWAPASVR